MLTQTNDVTFTNIQEQTLSAKIDLPLITPPRSYALFIHCFTCSKDIAIAARISKELADKGIATLRFDFTGLGESQGDFSKTNFSSNLQDLQSAVDFMQAHYQSPSLIIGHSLGGTAVLALAHKLPHLKAMVCIGAPSHPSHLKKHLEQQDGHYTFNLGQKPFVLCNQFMHDIQNIDLEHLAPQHKVHSLILHSPIDNIVSIKHAQTLYEKLKHPKSFISLDQADHLLSKKEDALYVGQLIASWFDRHLPIDNTKLDIEHGTVIVEELKQTLTQKISTSSHTIIADEPQNLGGKDLGLNPYDLLLASLGACTSMTLRMYARHKQINLNSIKVELKHEKIHAKDCQDCKTKTGKIDFIQRKIYLEGNLSPEQKQRFLEIANRCPVHKTLHSENKITTELA
ncbi:MAG TPA: alpha/beta fold hydrolase [Oligoflexia bacterium]|nr:alpha/beta fold hydrolase [Oligoflexia bacterium]HMR24551.1 alpha/beta fold hydrolase [Oligoflexia bacterium]